MGYGQGFTYRRKCAKCETHQPMAGGRTAPGGRYWVCSRCRKNPQEETWTPRPESSSRPSS
jgi:hypothetical protein